MPWHLLGSPSIQLGILQGVLERADVPCRSHSLYLEFQEFLAQRGVRDFTFDDYGEVCSRWQNLGLGDWLFAVPSIRKGPKAADERYVALLRESGMEREQVARLRGLRELVPEFLERCADEILSAEPAIVGFTSVYSQTWPSAALAHVLKERQPDLQVIFGGTSCEGPMGVGVLRAFPQVDVVFRGEAEELLPELIDGLAEGATVPRLPGLCFREGDEVVELPTRSGQVAMDDVPTPIYDEYFERLSRSSLAQQILPQLPLETSRGCWWGMKAHCTFCGLNGMDMAYRSKSHERVLEEVAEMSSRHGVLDFTSVDNIMDMRYFATLLPQLAERGHDMSFFYETKANLTEPQVSSLRAAGVSSIQPGIESLSTPILKLMRKGVTAIQNIRLLKWCAQRDIHVIWNLLYGFPREAPEEYERVAELVPSLVHLPAPSMCRLEVYRFSPYHNDPDQHGIELGGPLPYYRLLYDVDEASLSDLAQAFEYTHADGRDPEDYTQLLRKRVEHWNRDTESNRGALTYRRGPGFVVITDTRTTTSAGVARYTLGEAEAAAYLACEAGATVGTIAAEVRRTSQARLSDSELAGLLNDFVAARLVYEESGRYLSLALPRAVAPLAPRSSAG